MKKMDKGTMKVQTFDNTGGEPKPVPTGTAPGNGTKPHPNPGSRGPDYHYPKGGK